MKHKYKTLRIVLLIISTLSTTIHLKAADWPTWRYNVGRTNQSPEHLPAQLNLQWKRQLPPVKPAFRKSRLQFDQGYEPIVVGERLFLALPHLDAVAAYSTISGEQEWIYYTAGPVRLAPVAWEGKIYFGSDDGHLYCLNADEGTLNWKFQAVPSQRKVLGNGRLISVWPLRGGPVLAEGKIYFAAGVWPLEGVFVYSLDAKTGEVIWVNDRAGSLYGDTPHGGRSIAGLTPQGYLLVVDEELFVPCGTARPATFNRKTGEIIHFAVPKERNNPGGWFMMENTKAAKDVRRGKVVFDSKINQERHEGKPHVGPGVPGLRSHVSFGDQTLNYADGLAGVEGKIHSMAVANGRLFVTTLEGAIYAFGAEKVEPILYNSSTEQAKPIARSTEFTKLLKTVNNKNGYALVLGTRHGELARQLIDHSEFNVLALVPQTENITKLRQQFHAAGVPSKRLAFINGQLQKVGLPPYLADFIIAEDWNATGLAGGAEYIVSLYERLRPYGGTACLIISAERDAQIRQWLNKAGHTQAEIQREEEMLIIRRAGPLPGSVDYDKNWSAPDELVRAPVGILWYDDAIAHFKRAPQPSFREGIMISQDKDWRSPAVKAGRTAPYHEFGSARFNLLENHYSDVYTGRVLTEAETKTRLKSSLTPSDKKERQAYQYRPPYVKKHVAELAAKGAKPSHMAFLHPSEKGTMLNPITGKTEPRRFIKSYGCDGGIDYGHLFTMRSATPAFYDKRIESGTINISGPRSGCTNSIIPANGVLNVPFFYDGCSCSYPLPTSTALVSMPQTFEQWTAWGPSEVSSIQRIGINLGAPGDRMTNAGTLFVDHPSVGGPSPEIKLTTQPSKPKYFYHHALFTKGGKGWPWVCASGAKGLSSIRLDGLKTGKFTIRLYFIEPEYDNAGKRVFDVAIDGKTVLSNYDISTEAGSKMGCIVKEFTNVELNGTCEIKLTAQQGSTILSGIEIVDAKLTLDLIPANEK